MYTLFQRIESATARLLHDAVVADDALVMRAFDSTRVPLPIRTAPRTPP